jgi:serine/threonine-protein kinase
MLKASREKWSHGEMSEEGRYLILEPLGEGGSGSVFRTWDHKLNRMVALKRVKDNPGIFTSIRDEAGILASLDHPNIVTFLDYDQDENGHFVVMELVYGNTLEEWVFERPLSLAEFVPLMNQVCWGLSAAHELGLVHCDLKPGNIMLECQRDGSFTAKILDFGLATISVSVEIPETLASEGMVLHGTPQTMSPEQLRGLPMDARSDIYSLGCTFYYALSGCYPHSGEDANSVVQGHLYSTPQPLHLVRADIPEALSQVIMGMLAFDPEQRPQDVESVRVQLESAADAAL